MHILCPHCHNPIELVKITPREEIACPSCGSTFCLETGSTSSDTPRIGQKIDRFEVLDIVGQGSFGTVYKARDPQLDRVVALKVPRAGNLSRPEDLDRFLREARSVAQLRHPSIVAVHEIGQAGSFPFLVSDFVEGVTLADALSARRPAPREAAELIAQVADALHYAHSQGVVHRDVKPSNILLGPDGRPLVSDFGLAKRDAGEITMTLEGQILGTPAYMAPEQARGEAHRVDGRSDVYSLGVVLYELLTGELPFRGNTRMLLHQVLHDEPRPPRSLNDRLPRDLETACLKAMAKEPARRYASAEALAEDLRRFLRGEPIRARPAGRLLRAWKWAQRRPAIAAMVAVSAFALLSVVVVACGSSALIYLKNQDLSKTNAQLIEERNRVKRAEEESREALKQTEEVLLDGLLRPIGDSWSDEPGTTERQALRDVARLPTSDLRLRFLERGLSTPETGLRLSARSRHVLDAVVGDDAAMHLEARELVREGMRNRGADWRLRIAYARLGADLGESDPQFVREAAESLVKAPVFEDASFQLAIERSLLVLIRSMDPGAAGSLARKVVALIPGTVLSSRRDTLGRAIAACASRMQPTEATAVCAAAAGHLLADLRGHFRVENLPLVDVLTALAAHMNPDEAANIRANTLDSLIDHITEETSLSSQTRLVNRVAALTPQLDATAARRSALKAVKRLRAASALFYRDEGRYVSLGASLARAIAALASRMERSTATDVCGETIKLLLRGLTMESTIVAEDAEPSVRIAVADCVVELAPYLDRAAADYACGRLEYTRLVEKSASVREALSKSLHALIPLLDKEKAVRIKGFLSTR